MSLVTVLPVGGLPEITAGADLAGLIAEAATGLADGDIVVVTSKVVSKAEGRVVRADREDAIDAETVRIVARRGETRIAETRQGLVLAAAGVDASNTPPGTVVLLPEDPDGSARRLRKGLQDRLGIRLGVLVTDTLGRPWRTGQTDAARTSPCRVSAIRVSPRLATTRTVSASMASSRSARTTRPSALLTILEVTTTMSPSARPVAASAISPARSAPTVISGSPPTGRTVTRLMLVTFLAGGRRPRPAARQWPISESSFSYFFGQVEGGARDRGGRRRGAHVER